MTTEESNKLIAEFMEYPGDGNGLYFSPVDSSEKLYTPDKLPYNTSWDWLMPVIEKIESLGFSVNTITTDARIGKTYRVIINAHVDSKYAFGKLYEGDKKMDTLYQAVVQFIQWYNTQTTTT